MATYGQMGMDPGIMPDEESAGKMMREQKAPAAPASSGWVVDNVTIKRAANGGWIVTCSKHQEPAPKNGPGYQSKDYTFASLAEAAPFIEAEFGESAEGGGMPMPAVPQRG